MMEEELRKIVEERGWSLYKRTRGVYSYFYALKWRKDQVYLTSGDGLAKLTKEKVLAKLANAR